MTSALSEASAAVAEFEEEPKPSPYLRRVLDETEQATALQKGDQKRRATVAERTPHPFAYD